MAVGTFLENSVQKRPKMGQALDTEKTVADWPVNAPKDT